MYVTDFQHVKQNFVDAYTRLVAMKLFGLRTADYMRVASKKDRRYLLYSPVMKMKTTTQGEEVINLLWDVIAAKGFGIVDVAGNRKNFPVLIQRVIGGYQCAAGFPSFDHQGAQTHSGNDPVAPRKIRRVRLGSHKIF